MTGYRHAKSASKRLRLDIRGFLKGEDGAAAVEAAFISIPYFLIIFSILEVAVFVYAHALINTGTAQASRLLRTRQVTAQSHSAAQFRQILCDLPAMRLFDCAGLGVDVQEVAQFNNPPVPRNPDGSLNATGMSYAPGPKDSINIVRVYYQWPVIFNKMQKYLDPNFNDSGLLLVSTEAYMTE